MKNSAQPIKNSYFGKSIISLNQFDPLSIKTLFTLTASIKKYYQSGKFATPLAGKLAALLFFEPSSRTFSSQAAAVKRLGGQTIEYQDPLKTSSAVKGETLEDTMLVFENYVDIIIMRHPEKGAPERAVKVLTKPFINAGDGSGEHPTQALLDMFTLYERFGTLSNMTGVFAGDLLYGRTVHSLLTGLSLYKNNHIYLLSPKQLQFPADRLEKIRRRGITVTEIEKETDIPSDCHFWYWTRVQKERFADHDEYEKLKHRYVLATKLLQRKGNEKLILMHPLPRAGEIEEAVDADSRAVYLKDEIQNGLYVRMALLTLILTNKVTRFT